jgi:uncharacterized protein YegP (UPF0339 family)
MPKFLIYRDRIGEYRWHLKANNGRILGDSAGGYHSAKACRRSIAKLKLQSKEADITHMGRG